MFQNVQTLLVETGLKYARKADEVFSAALFEDDDISLNELLGELHRHSMECGSRVVSNGTDRHSVPQQVNLFCRKCKWERRYPLKRRTVDVSMLSIPSDVSQVSEEFKNEPKISAESRSFCNTLSPEQGILDSFFRT